MAKKTTATTGSSSKKTPEAKKPMYPSAYSTAKTIQKRKNLNQQVMDELDL